MSEARCLHNMLHAACAFCSPPRKPHVPAHSKKRTPHGTAAGLLNITRHGIAVVHTKNRKLALLDIAELDTEIDFVHFDGHPFLWAVEAVAARLPKLQTVQLIPKMVEKFQGAARALCDARGIQIIGGHIRPEVAWDDTRIGNPFYTEQRRFMLGMAAEQKALFDELITLGFDTAKMTARYFCLADEEYVPMRCLAEEYGFAKGATSSVSSTILGVLRYLDETLEVGDTSRRRAEALRAHVARLRPMLASAEYRQQVMRELGVTSLAPTLPIARIEIFAKVLTAWRDGRLAALHREEAWRRDHDALVFRFGLDSVEEPTYRTLTEVGALLGGVTRERARQLESRALERLGIKEET